MSFPIQTTNAMNYLAVKPGEEHPVDKNGQYRLFKEHPWPRGYSPDRMRKINDLQFNVVASGFTSYDPNESDETRQKRLATESHIGRVILNENLAKSSIPVADLEKIAKNERPFKVWMGHETTYPEGPSFNPSNNTVQLAMKNDDTAADVQSNVVHEFGHAHDYASDHENFWDKLTDMGNQRFNYGYRSGNQLHTAHPDLEGYAEGYRLAHSRVTPTDKKIGGNTSKMGYSPLGWVFEGNFDAADNFMLSRLQSFHKATGRPELPPEGWDFDERDEDEETPSKVEHPTLFSKEELNR